jgi:hypothetical protein
LDANPPATRTWNPTAALGAWLLPGLGHLLIGESRRGAILMVTIGAVWLGGLLIGGISVIDRKDHPAWFLGQMMLAPSVGINIIHQNLRLPPPMPGNARFEPSFGQVYEQGMLYTLLAGLLNLLAILDVTYRHDPGWQDGTAQKARQA